MTSISGYYVVQAPCCGTLYSKTAYASINMMNWQRWTDGYESGPLYSSPEGVCYCRCGQFFLTKDAEQVDFVRYQKSGILPASSSATPDSKDPLPRVFQERAFELVTNDADLPGGKTEALIRLLVWQAMNEADRVKSEDDWAESRAWVVAELRKKLGTQFKEAEAKPWERLTKDQVEAIQLANLSKLIPLLKSFFPKRHLLIGNAYRAHGDQQNAIERFNRVTNEPHKIVQHLIKATLAGDRKVIRIDPPEWLDEPVMPEPWVNHKPTKNPVVLSSKWFWFKIFGMLNQLWALIEPKANSETVTIYWIDDNARIVNSEECASEEAAYDQLIHDGYRLFENEPDVWEILRPPGGPYNTDSFVAKSYNQTS